MDTVGSWAMTLRCYKCRSVFTLERVPESKVPFVTESADCPSCGAVAEARISASRRRHLIVEMAPEEPL